VLVEDGDNCSIIVTLANGMQQPRLYMQIRRGTDDGVRFAELIRFHNETELFSFTDAAFWAWATGGVPALREFWVSQGINVTVRGPHGPSVWEPRSLASQEPQEDPNELPNAESGAHSEE